MNQRQVPKQVQILSTEETTFPDTCLVCGAQEPSAKRDFVLRRWRTLTELNASSEKLKCVYSVPACPSCVSTLVWSIRLRKILLGVGSVVGASLASAALTWSPESFRSSTWVFLGFVLVLMGLPFLLAWKCHAPYFSLSTSRLYTVFRFRDSNIADRFERLNLGAKN